MKSIFFLALALSFTTQLAHSDYVPGRTRASAEAAMEKIAGDGIHRDVDAAKLVEFYTDSKGITKYELTLKGKKMEFQVTKASGNECVSAYEAVGADGARLSLTDISLSDCESSSKYSWEASITTPDGSRLVLGGEPEHYILTQ